MESHPSLILCGRKKTFSLERIRGRTGDEAPVSYIDHEVDVQIAGS